MKNMNRTNYREQGIKATTSYYCGDNEAKSLKSQIDQAWREKEQEEKDRIQEETYHALREYDALIHSHKDEEASIEENTAIEIEEYFKSLDGVEKAEP